ncbi:hypothetical protein D3C80_1055730 [compost metagenome]
MDVRFLLVFLKQQYLERHLAIRNPRNDRQFFQNQPELHQQYKRLQLHEHIRKLFSNNFQATESDRQLPIKFRK